MMVFNYLGKDNFLKIFNILDIIIKYKNNGNNPIILIKLLKYMNEQALVTLTKYMDPIYINKLIHNVLPKMLYDISMQQPTDNTQIPSKNPKVEHWGWFVHSVTLSFNIKDKIDVSKVNLFLKEALKLSITFLCLAVACKILGL